MPEKGRLQIVTRLQKPLILQILLALSRLQTSVKDQSDIKCGL